MFERNGLDVLIKDTTTCTIQDIPQNLLKNFHSWKFGKYGWLSPVSLFLTAAWHKYRYPTSDICKIWARDTNNKKIPGSYSIRSEDEKLVIPLLAKYDLCKGFCSPNSGMQGSRAIEKMRIEKRINLNFATNQKTIFDLKLFATILNQINNLHPDESLSFCQLFIVTAKKFRDSRLSQEKLLEKPLTYGRSPYRLLEEIHDPELTKCITAACLHIIYSSHGFILHGIEDAKTVADARAKKPGDLCLYHNNRPLIAVEVKDKTQDIDWQNIDRATQILKRFSSLEVFLFVLEKRSATASPEVQDILKSTRLTIDFTGNKIAILSFHTLYRLALSLSSETIISNLTSKFIKITPAIKQSTIKKWITHRN